MAAPLQFEVQVSEREANQLLGNLRTGGEAAAKALNDALGGTVTKKLVLETVTDASGAKRLVAVEKERLSVADEIIRQQRKLNDIQSGSVTSLRGMLREATQVRDQTAKMSDGVDRFGRAIKQANPDWAIANQRVAAIRRELDVAGASNFWQKLKATSGIGSLLSFGNGLTQITQQLQSASILIGQLTGAINTLVRAGAEIQSIALSFKAIGQGSIGGVTALQETQRIALGLGASLDNVQTGFTQLAPVVLKTGGEMSDVSDITEALASRFAAFGIQGDRARRIMNGVIQAFAKGKLMAEELTQQISEADPAFKTDLAEALNTSVAGLEELVKQGRITSEVLIDVLPKLGKSSLLFGKLGSSAGDAVGALQKQAVTIDQVRNQLDTLSKLNLRTLATKADPLINTFLGLRAVVTDLISDLLSLPISDSIISALSSGGEVAKQFLDALSNLARGVAVVASAFAPLIDTLLAVPGVAQAVGLILVGKLIEPLKGGISVVGAFGQKVRSFTAGLSASFNGAVAPVKGVTNALEEASRVAPALSGGLSGQFTAGLAGAAAAARDFTGESSKLTLGLNALSAQGGDIGKALDVFSDKTATAAERTTAYNAVMDSSKAAYDKMQAEIAQTRAELAALEAQQKKMRGIIATPGVSPTKAIGAQTELDGLDVKADRARQKIAGLTTESDKLNAAMGRFAGATRNGTRAFDETSSAAVRASTGVGRFEGRANSLSRISSGLAQSLGGGLKAALAGISSILGPLQLALIAVGVGFAAFNSYNKESQRIAKESEERIAALDKTIRSLGTASSASVEPPQGAALAWMRLGEAIDNIGLSFKAIMATAAGAAAVIGAIVAIIAIIGTGGAAAAPLIAGLAATGAGLTLVASTGDGAAISQRKFQKELRKTSEEADKQIKKVEELTAKLIEQQKLDDRRRKRDVDQGKEDPGLDPELSAGYEEILGVYKQLKSEVDDAKESAASAKDEFDLLPDAVRAIYEGMGEGNALSDAFRRALLKLVPEETIKKAEELRLQMSRASQIRAALTPKMEKAGKAVDKVAESQGRLTAKEAESAVTMQSLSEEIKQNEEKLQGLDRAMEGAQWDQTNRKIGELRAQLKLLQEDAKNAQDIEAGKGVRQLVDSIGAVPNTIKAIQGKLQELQEKRNSVPIDSSDFKLLSGEIVKLEDRLKAVSEDKKTIEVELKISETLGGNGSIQAASEAISAIESRIVNLSISSPELPFVISQLVALQDKADELNGKRAKITVELLEKTGNGQSISSTLNQISRYTSQLEAQKLTIPIDSPEIDGVIEKIEEVKIKAEAGALSSDQLRTRVQEFYWQKEADYIQKTEQEEDKRHQSKLRNLQAELAAIDKQLQAQKAQSDEVIKRLQSSIPDPSKGPAAQALAAYQRQQLQIQAGSRDTGERLAARAQLEALDYAEQRKVIEDQIAREQENQRRAEEKAAADRKRVEAAQKAAEAERQKAKEESDARLLELQEKIAQSQKEAALAFIEIAKELIKLRSAFEGGGGRQPQQGANQGGKASSSDSAAIANLDAISSRLQGNKKDFEAATQASNEFYDSQGKSKYLGSSAGDTIISAEGWARAYQEAAKQASPEAARRAFDSFISSIPGVQERILEQARKGMGSDLVDALLGGAVDPSLLASKMDKFGEVAGGSFQYALVQAMANGETDSVQALESWGYGLRDMAAISGDLATAQERQATVQRALNTAIASGASAGIIQSLQSQFNEAGAAVNGFQTELQNTKTAIDVINSTGLSISGDQDQSLAPLIQEASSLNGLLGEVGQKAATFSKNLGQADTGGVEGELASASTQAALLASSALQAGQALAAASSGAQNLDTGTSAAEESLGSIGDEAANLQGQFDSAATASRSLGEGATAASSGINSAAGYSSALAGQLGQAASQAQNISNSINSLDGTTVTIKVNVVPSRWTGGPVEGGQTYQVNEIGREGFLSASGRLSQINAPRNSLWRAPGKGTVIPAHEWREINAPRYGSKPSLTPGQPRAPKDRLGSAIRSLGAAMARQGGGDPGLSRVASAQAQQALQIGKLSSAIEDLTRKDWNMKVNVKSYSNRRLEMQTVNRLL